MPSTATTTMLAASLDNRSKEIHDQSFEAHILLKYLNRTGRKKAATPANNIEEPISVGANSTVGVRDYKSQIPFEEQDPVQVVEIPFRHFNGSVVWYKWQERVNASSKQKLFDFVDSLVEQLKMTMGDTFGLQIWEDGSDENMHGLGAIISATNTYMGLNRSTTGNEWWKAKTGAAFTITFPGGGTKTYGPFSTAGTLQIMGGTDGGIQGLVRACSANGGTDQPDFGITTEALYNRIEQLIEPSRIRQSAKLVELGWDENIAYGNMGIVYDDNCTSAAFYSLNTKYLKLRPSTDNESDYWKSEVQDLLVNGYMAHAKVFNWDGNLVCTRPTRCGALTGKTAS